MTETELSSYLVAGMGKMVVDRLVDLSLDDSSIAIHCLSFAKESNTRAMKASWLLSTRTKKEKSFPASHQAEILRLAKESKIGGVRRELLKALDAVPLEVETLGQLVQFSLLLLQDLDQDRAVRYIALKHLQRASKKYPELADELAQIEVYLRERTGDFP